MDETLLVKIGRVFDRAGVEYALVGRSAARLHGASDGDLEVEALARLTEEDLDQVLAAARAAGLGVDAGLASLAVSEGEHLTLFPGGDAYVDVKPARSASDLATLRTRISVAVEGGVVMAASAEDTVARLLDQGDVGSFEAAREVLMAKAAELDRGLLGERCEELHVTHLLREADPKLAVAP